MSQGKRSVLFVSIAFPPKNDPEALQAGRYFRALKRFDDLEFDVVTSANPTLWMPYDPSLAIDGCRQRIELPIFEPRLLSVVAVRFFRGWTLLPDTRMSFHLQWRRAVRALKSKPDVIYSRCYPLSSNIMAMKLARHYGVPWVMHMSDPWVAPGFDTYRGYAARYNERAERACFEAATAITLASDRIRDLYRQRYSHVAHKLHVTSNVFDEELLARRSDTRKRTMNGQTGGDSNAPGGRLRIAYTGTADSMRSLRYLFRALTRAFEKQPALRDSIHLDIAGQIDAGNRALIEEHSQISATYYGMVPFQRAREIQENADLLVVIDNPIAAEHAVYFPSKILDYMTAGAPILAITTPGSMTTEILRPETGVCFAHEDIDGTAQYLTRLRRAPEQLPVDSSEPPSMSNKIDARYSPSHNAAILRELLRTI